MLLDTGRFTDLATALGVVRGCLVDGVRAATVRSPGLGPWALLAGPGSLACGPGSLGLSSVLAAPPGSLWLLSSWVLAGAPCDGNGVVSLVPFVMFLVSLCTLKFTTGRCTDLATAPCIVGDCLMGVVMSPAPAPGSLVLVSGASWVAPGSWPLLSVPALVPGSLQLVPWSWMVVWWVLVLCSAWCWCCCPGVPSASNCVPGPSCKFLVPGSWVSLAGS